jgi:hypothetical protein
MDHTEPELGADPQRAPQLRPSFATAAAYFEALAEKTRNDDDRRHRLLEVAAFYRSLARIIPEGAVAPFGRAERWKARAEECRTLADSFTDPTCRRQLTELAQDYEHMALTAE